VYRALNVNIPEEKKSAKLSLLFYRMRIDIRNNDNYNIKFMILNIDVLKYIDVRLFLHPSNIIPQYVPIVYININNLYNIISV